MVNTSRYGVCKKMRRERMLVKILSMGNGRVSGYLADNVKGTLYYFNVIYTMKKDGRIKLRGLDFSRKEQLRIKEAMFVEIAKKVGNPIFA